MGFTFSATTAWATNVDDAHVWLIAASAAILGMYLVNPVAYVIFKSGSVFNCSLYKRDLFFYCYNGLLILVATWLTLVAAVYDGITPFF
jgi:hypothetical protein